MADTVLRVESVDELHHALARARQLRLEAPDQAIDIELQAGTYRLDRSLQLSPSDSGIAGAPLRIRSRRGESVSLIGSLPLGAFGDISLPAVAGRLSLDQRNNIVEIALTDVGIPPVTEIEQRGTPPIELFCRGERLPLSRFPDEGWLRIEDVPQDGPERLHEGLGREKRYQNVPVGRHYGRFIYPGERPERWAFQDEILAHGYWTWDWNDSYQTISSIDTQERSVHLAPPHHNYGYTTQQRFAFCNILEEVDAAGKWCFHRRTGRIYLWPPEGGSGGLSASALRDPLISIQGASHICIEGIEFTESLGSGVLIEACDSICVTGCTFTRLGGTAVVLDGTRCEIRSSDFNDLSLGAIVVTGGDRKTLTPGENRVDNNHIWNYSRWVRTYQYAVTLDGVAHQVTHNLVHDAPQEAMRFAGNEHLFEFNEIHSIVTETGDSGAIHTGRDWTWRGTVLRHNLIHGLAGDGLHGAMGIYLDDFMSGTTIQGNILCRAGRAAFLGGGRDNIVENNLFIACKASVHLDARGTSWAAYYFDGTYPVLFDAMEAMRFGKPPYCERYPELTELYGDDPAIPKNNRIRRNISFGGLWIEFRDKVRITDIAHEQNYVADEVLCEQLRPDLDTDPYFLNIDGADPYERISSSSDPHIADFERGGNIVAQGTVPAPGWRDRDFTVDPEVARQIGFEQIPFEEIGLYCDEYRRTLPSTKMPGE